MNILQKYRNMPVQIKASFWFLVSAFLQRGISAITTPIFTRLLTTAEYGQYNVFSSWMAIITCFVTLNIYGGVYSQGLVKFDKNRSQFASAFQGLMLTLTAAWLVFYLIFNNFINPLLSINKLQGILMLVIIWSNGVYQLWAQEQRVYFRYRTLVVVTCIYSLLAPILSIVLIKTSEDKVTARIVGIALAAVIAYDWMFFNQIRKGKVFYSKNTWKYALNLAIPLIPHYLSQMILNSSDRIMIQSMVGSSEAGIYSLAYSVSQIMTIFNTALLSTIEPWIYQKIKSKELDKLHKVAYPSFILIAAINLLLIAFAPEVIRVFAPAEYYQAIWVIPSVAMSVFFVFLYSYFATFEFYYEKTQYITIATITGAVLNIILNYIFIKLWGYYAAGYTTLVCYIVYSIMHYHFMKKICLNELGGVRIYNLQTIIKISFIFMLIGFSIMMTYTHIYIRYGVIITIATIGVIFRKRIKSIIYDIVNLRKDAQ